MLLQPTRWGKAMALQFGPKRWLKKALWRSGTLRVAGRLAPPSAAILMYHSIVEEPQLTMNILGVSQSRANFEAHMKTLVRRFSPVTIEQVAQFAKDGRRLPVRAVAVTFDDGFRDNYDVALPILSRYGISATIYVMVNAVATGMLPWYCRLRFALSTTTRPEWRDLDRHRNYELVTPAGRQTALRMAWDIGAKATGSAQEEFVRQVEESLEVEPPAARNGFMLSWEELRALRKAGQTIGGHTLSHPNLAHVSEGDARSEIAGCKKRLEEELSEPVDHFSYPHPALNPQWNPQTLAITRETGFKSAVLTERGPVRAGDEPLRLKRIYAAKDLDQWIWNLESTFLGRSIR